MMMVGLRRPFAWGLTPSILLLGFLWVAAFATALSPCPTCDVAHCPKTPRECSHGLVRDECGCCEEGVCLLLEREKCLDLNLFKNIAETELKKFGVCGEDMDCLPRTDLKAGETQESECRCRTQEASCGKDNSTYLSICQLREAGTELKHSGPCATTPEISSEPEAASVLENDRLSLSCEAKGFPVPIIHWEFEGLNGLFKSLPGDDPAVAVHARGGPEPFTITSWLMIEAARPSDAGTYVCIARSNEGVARFGASVYVRRKDS